LGPAVSAAKSRSLTLVGFIENLRFDAGCGDHLLVPSDAIVPRKRVMVDVRYATGPIATETYIPMAQVLTMGGSLANDEVVFDFTQPSKSSH
jgi:hypothetical protein